MVDGDSKEFNEQPKSAAKDRNATSTGLVIVTMLVIYFAFTSGADFLRNFFHDCLQDNSAEGQIRDLAAEMNKTLPINVDARTRFDRVEAGPRKKLTFIFIVSSTLSEKDKTSLELSPTWKSLAVQDLERRLGIKVPVSRRYLDNAGAIQLEFYAPD